MDITPKPVPAIRILPALRLVIISALCIVYAIKTLAAANFDLFGDEAFYYQCAQRLAICYVDHPFMTALLVRGGIELAGHTTLGVRLLFLVLGLAVPLGIYLLARPLVGSKDAWLAMGLSLLMLPFSLITLMAIPDVPLIACIILGLALFERATRCGGILNWSSAGVITALGLCTHYRFFPFIIAALLYLVATKHGRACFQRSGPWFGLAFMCCGFLPIIVYNIQLSWEPLWFQFYGRHSGSLKAMELLAHPLQQMLAVTPLLYAALIVSLIVLWRKARRGDHRSALLAIFSSTFLGGYFLLSPWSDSVHVDIHWPLPGYVPLLVVLPGVLRNFIERNPTILRRITAVLTPGISGLVTLLFIVEIAWNPFGVRFLQNSFTGWSAFGAHVNAYLLETDLLFIRPDIIVADNYKLAAQLEFYAPEGVRIFTLEHRRNREHGRNRQYRLWQADEQALRQLTGHDALVVVEVSAVRPKRRTAWQKHVASLFRELEHLDRLEVQKSRGKQRIFDFYLGSDLLRSSPDPSSKSGSGHAP